MSIPDHSISRKLLLRRHRRRWILSGTSLILLCMAVLSAGLGSVRISPVDVWASIRAGLNGNRPESLNPGIVSVIWDIRLPRIMMALFAGMSLSLGGAAMQGIMRNPMVSPYTLGISAASAFGASLAIVLDIPGFIIPMAFLTALLSLFLVLLFSQKDKMQVESLILAGIAVMFAFSAGTSLLQYLASQDELTRIVFWLMGSLGSTTWLESATAALIFLIFGPFIYSLSWRINILSSGDDGAGSLGIHPQFLRMAVILGVTLVTAVIVSFSGVIGFIGLASPHIARILFGSDHRLLFPASALTGALFLLVSDTLARTLLGNTELPIGIITSFIGVPFLIAILMNRRKFRNVL